MSDLQIEEEIKIGIPSIGIPAEALFNPYLSPNEKILFGFLRNLSRTKRGCWASNRYLGSLIGIGKQAISNAVSNLTNLEYITVNYSIDKNGNKQRNIFINEKNYIQKYKELSEFVHEYLYNKKYIPIKDNLYTYIKKVIFKEVDIKEDNKEENIYSKEYITDFKKSETNSSDNQKINPLAKLTRFDKYSIRLITYWNNIKHTSTHKLKRPWNKVCRNMILALNSLQKGTFAKNRHFDPEWIKKENIPRSFFTRTWTYEEIKFALTEAAKYSMEGYWPPSKKDNFKSLAYIIYNGTDRSWLLTASQNPPQPFKETQFKNPFPKLTANLIQHPIWPKDYQFNEQKLAKGLLELKSFSKNLIQDSYNKSHQYFGDLPKLLKEYTAWLEEQNWITDISENLFGTGNKVFHKFIEFQEKEIGIKIRSKGWK